MSSHTASGPKTQRATNMPAIDSPMKKWEISTSRPSGRRVATEETNSTSEYAATTSIRAPKR